MKRKIRSWFSGKPKCLSPFSNTTSHPCVEWKPTKISVNNIIRNALAVSLKPYISSLMNDLRTAICLPPVKIKYAKLIKESISDSKFLIASVPVSYTHLTLPTTPYV